jgi:hypothetical protein
MGYRLRDGIYWCIAQDVPIFLDLADNRYFSVTGPAADLFRQFAGGDVDGATDGSIAPLVEAGILVASDDVAIPLPTIRPRSPAGGLVEPCERPRWASCIRALVGLRGVRRELARQPLIAILGGLDRQRQVLRRVAASPDAVIQDMVAAFRWTGRIVATHDQCLPRTLAQARYLIRSGVRPQIVFGVTVRPFAAHCWPEHDGRILDDDPDQAALFSPILIW